MTAKTRRVPLWLALATREATANRAFTLSFIINLSLGLIGFLTVAAFKVSIQDHLDGRSQALMGGDVELSARRMLSEDEIAAATAALPPGSLTRRETGMLSMVAGGVGSRLVMLRAVDDAFPFYGQPLLKHAGELAPERPRAIVQTRGAWVAPELLTQLGVAIGDPLHIGGVDFTILDVIEHDPTAGNAGLEIAPKVFIGERYIADTTLVAKGSRVFQSLIVKLPALKDADQVAAMLKERLPSRELRIRSHRQASTELNRALTYLSDYLGLVALVALFLAGVGGAYLFRSFLARRSRDIAILLSLGLPLAQVRLVYATQLAIMGIAATGLTTLLSAALLPLLPVALGPLVPPGMEPTITGRSLLTVLALGVGGSLLFCLPLLARLSALKPATLFQEDGQTRGFELSLSPRQALAWIPALLAYWAMAVNEAQSLVVGSLFVAIFLVALLILGGVGYALTRALARPSPAGSFIWEMASLSLARHRAATVTSFVALGLGALLMNLVPQIRGLIDTELSEPGAEARPSLFLFDIQEDQLSGIESELAKLGAKLDYVSPLVRARLVGINGQETLDDGESSFTTREDQEERRARNRGYNLSYREGLAPSETLVKGRTFTGPYAGGGTPELTLELRFADRLGVGVGDRLSFEVQGVPIDGVVVGLRRVRWTSFHPNFFVQFQPGVLDDAPKTLVAAIPNLDDERKLTAQTAVVRTFPNVSIIDVTQTVERILAIVGQMSLALGLMALLSLVAGLAVLYAIAHHQAQRRLPDVTLLKVLGADFPRLRAIALAEFGVLGLAAAGIGATLSVGAAYVLSWVAFDRLWSFDWRLPLSMGLGLALLCTLTGVAATSRSLRGKPATLLGAARFN